MTHTVEVIGLQSGVGGDQLRPQLAHKAQRGTAVASREGTYTALVLNIDNQKLHFRRTHLCFKKRQNAAGKNVLDL